MLSLLALSVICLAVTLDRALFWLSSALRHRPIPPEIYDNSNPERKIVVAQLCSKRPKHYTREVLLTCLQPSVSKGQIAQTVSEQVDIMSSRLSMLDLIAKIAPLVGILGTVIGMAVSFGGIGAIVTASPTAISNGISIALRTTAYGLIISIAASIASATFKRRVRRATLKMGRIICGIHDTDNNV
jgi:biopolymer transport protein ExbB